MEMENLLCCKKYIIWKSFIRNSLWMKNDHKLPTVPSRVMHGTARTKQKGWILFAFNFFMKVINLSDSYSSLLSPALRMGELKLKWQDKHSQCGWKIRMYRRWVDRKLERRTSS